MSVRLGILGSNWAGFNAYIKEIMGVKGKTDVIDIIERKRLQ
jgi:hypothetical protein